MSSIGLFIGPKILIQTFLKNNFVKYKYLKDLSLRQLKLYLTDVNWTIFLFQMQFTSTRATLIVSTAAATGTAVTLTAA